MDSCNFTNVKTGYNSAAISLTTGSKHQIVNCNFFNNTLDYDIYVTSEISVYLNNNKRDDQEEAKVNDQGLIPYVPEYSFTVEPGATGTGSGGSPVNITYALDIT